MECQQSSSCQREPEASLGEFFMQDNYKPRIQVVHVTDDEIETAIRYLDSDQCGVTKSPKRNSVLAICSILMATVISILAYIWLYFRAL